jgi:hypothetical protein
MPATTAPPGATPSPSPAPPPPPPLIIHRLVPLPPSAPRADAQGPRPALGFGPLLAGGTAPDVALGLNGFLRFLWPPWSGEDPGLAWSFAIEGRGDLASRQDVGTQDEVGSSLFAGATATCLHYGAVLAGFGCHVATIGWVRGTAPGAMANDSSISLFSATGLRFGLELALAPPYLSVQATVDGHFNVIRPQVDIEHERAWRAEIVSGTASLRAVGFFF